MKVDLLVAIKETDLPSDGMSLIFLLGLLTVVLLRERERACVRDREKKARQ